MNIRIPKRIIKQWIQHLIDGGDREVGGILFGECLKLSDFRILDITFQKTDGDEYNFIRNGEVAREEIMRLSDKYGHKHSRYNYFGEWHSHPNSPTCPSKTDVFSMRELLNDFEVKTDFLVLIIVKLNDESHLEISSNTFLNNGDFLPCKIIIED